MLQHIAGHYQEPALDVAAIARHAKFHLAFLPGEGGGEYVGEGINF